MKQLITILACLATEILTELALAELGFRTELLLTELLLPVLIPSFLPVTGQSE
jgi:hypothetical protein